MHKHLFGLVLPPGKQNRLKYDLLGVYTAKNYH